MDGGSWATGLGVTVTANGATVTVARPKSRQCWRLTRHGSEVSFQSSMQLCFKQLYRLCERRFVRHQQSGEFIFCILKMTFTYFPYRFNCILCIFYILFDIFCILISITYYAYFAYRIAYWLHSVLHIVLHILHTANYAYYAYSMHILHIVCILFCILLCIFCL